MLWTALEVWAGDPHSKTPRRRGHGAILINAKVTVAMWAWARKKPARRQN